MAEILISMDFNTYQAESRKTAIYPNVGQNFIYPTLGLAGEAGEVAEKIKKVLRDNNGTIAQEQKELLKKELGDVLWYVSQLASELGLTMEDIAQHNINKLKDRQIRNTLHGDGDTR